MANTFFGRISLACHKPTSNVNRYINKTKSLLLRIVHTKCHHLKSLELKWPQESLTVREKQK